MTTLKIDGKPTATARDGIDAYIPGLYATPGKRLVGVIELEHVERVEPAPGADREASVRVRISALEIANPDQEDQLRRAQQALYLHRTAMGTLGEDGDWQLAKDTLDRCAGMLHALEAARLRAATNHARNHARRVLAVPEITVAEMRHELDQLADMLDATLRAVEFDDQGED